MGMDTPAPEQLILEEGTSEALVQAFRLLQDATAPAGGPRYPLRTCRELARAVVCRTYAGPILELSHLIVAAAAKDPSGRYENFFWTIERATPAAFQGAFKGARDQRPGHGQEQGAAIAVLSEAVTVRSDGVVVTLGGKPFTVTYARMPLLAALLEFLMTALGYRTIDEVLAPLITRPLKSAQVGDVANALSREVYAYLKDHLPAVQTQRRNRQVVQFLSNRHGGVLDADAIDDASVLAYWCHASLDLGEGAVESRTYTGAFHSVARLVKILSVAIDRAEMSGARSIGYDRDAGEVDPAAVEETLAAVEDAEDLLAPFDEAPLSGIKFLNGRERETLGDLTLAAGTGDRFPLSVMRNAIFGRFQSKVSNALRRQMSDGDVAQMIEHGPEQDYASHLAALSKVDTHLRRLLLAVFWVLVEAQRPEAIDLALALDPGLDLGDMASEADLAAEDLENKVVVLGAEHAMAHFFRRAAAGDGALASLAKAAKDALKSLARQGFRAEDREAPEVIDGFRAAPGAVKIVARETGRYLNKHGGHDWTAQFSEDLPVFLSQFKRIYGGVHV